MSIHENKLHVQTLLLNRTLNEIKAMHGINFRFAENCGNRKFSLNYDMLESKDSDPVAAQCRGVVLYRTTSGEFNGDVVVGETKLLCRTMPRFFNLGQGAAAPVDFETSRFFEKLDGTMIALHYDSSVKNRWCIATRSVPEADLFIDGFETFTFSTLFEKAVSETSGMSFESWLEKENLNKAYTYVFELCTPVNQVVVRHENYRAYSIAVLNTASGKEYSIDDQSLSIRCIPLCQTYKLKNLDDMLAFVSNLDGHMHEGLVVCDDRFNRVKVKNAQYLALSRINDSACKSNRSLLELCLSGKLDDALPLLSVQVQSKAGEFKEALVGHFNAKDKAYDECLNMTKIMIEKNGWDLSKDYRKAVALSVKQNKLASMPYTMARLNGKTSSMREYVESLVNPDGSYPKGLLDSILESESFLR
jgi:hypothetical protein